MRSKTARLGLPLDISEERFMRFMQRRKSPYSLYNPYLNFIETDFTDCVHVSSKCVTAVDQDFRCSDQAGKPDLFQDYMKFLNPGNVAGMVPQKCSTRQQV